MALKTSGIKSAVHLRLIARITSSVQAGFLYLLVCVFLGYKASNFVIKKNWVLPMFEKLQGFDRESLKSCPGGEDFDGKN